MDWFNISAPMVSLVFVGDDGGHDACIEIFPSRWTWIAKPEDAIGAMAAEMLSTGGMKHWNRHLPTSWDPAASGVRHPLAQAQDGGIFAHQGAPLAVAHTWSLANGTVTDPSGTTWNAQAFTQGPFFSGRKASFHAWSQRESSDIHATLLGALCGLDGAPIATDAQQLCGVITRTARSLQPKANKATLESAWRAGRDVAESATGSWTVRGNRPFAPTAFVADTQALRHNFPPALEPWFQAGKAAMATLIASGVPSFVLGDPDVSRGTAHERVAGTAALAAARMAMCSHVGSTKVAA